MGKQHGVVPGAEPFTDTLVPLNAEEAVSRLAEWTRVRALLRLHGIPAGRGKMDAGTEGSPAPTRCYVIHLFQQRVVQVIKHEGPGVWLHRRLGQRTEENSETVDPITDVETRRAVALAVRSLYALGLDFGMIRIGADSPHRLRVIGADPAPVAAGLLARGYREAFADFRRRVHREQGAPYQVVIGADPEFALRTMDGEMGIASRFVGRQGTVGYDAARLREEAGLTSHHPLVELRPEPAAEPAALFANLYRAMRRAAREISDSSLEWLAGGMPFDGYPLGGHIHFSGVEPTFSLIRKLDAYLCLPLAMIEDDGCRRRRPRYGFLGDVRQKAHGGFEYRTLPSWLVSPHVTRGVLALAKLVASNHWRLSQEPLRDVRLQQAYYTGDKAALRPVVADLWKELEILPMYARYRRELDRLAADVFAGKAWPADHDVRRAWKLPPFDTRAHAGRSSSLSALQPYRTVV